MATSFGGVMHLATWSSVAIFLVKSGPSMAPVAGRSYGQAEAGPRDIIVCDTGGTSFDVSLVRDGVVKFTRETWLGEIFTGHITGLASVDVASIGAGGGSIAWIDSGGLMRVGPQSAGSEPGPACYGRGGVAPDSHRRGRRTGVYRPELFPGRPDEAWMSRRPPCGGRDRRATRLEVSRKVAHGILEIANEHMVGAIKDITINQGIDPRESLIIAGGGAAGLSILPIARELGCNQVLVPRTAGALSACGGQFSNVLTEFSMSRLAYTETFLTTTCNRTSGRKSRESIERFEAELRGKGLGRFQSDYFVEARYPYQVWELEVALAKGGSKDQKISTQMIEAFHRRARARLRRKGT